MANTTAINSELFQNLLVQSEFALYENSVARAVAQVFDYPMGAGKQVSVPVWAGITAATPGEGVAPAAADTNTSSKLITLAEHVVYAQVTDFLRDSAQENVIASLGAQAGSALAESIDKLLIAEFANASGTQGAAGQELAITDILAAAAKIRANKYSGRMVAIISPAQAYALKAAAVGTAAIAGANLQNRALDSYFVTSVGGVDIYESSLIVADGNGDAVGCVFAPQAFGIAQRGGVNMEEQRQAAARATDVVMTAVAGAGTLRPELAVKLVFDSAI